MTDQDRHKRNMDLIRKSRQALENTELKPRQEASTTPAVSSAPAQEQETTIMYRGKAIKRPGRAMKVPGVAQNARRGQPRTGRNPGSSAGGATQEVKGLLESLAELYSAKLISKVEYDRKRNEILKRL